MVRLGDTPSAGSGQAPDPQQDVSCTSFSAISMETPPYGPRIAIG